MLPCCTSDLKRRARKSRSPGGLGWGFYVILFFASILMYLIIKPPS